MTFNNGHKEELEYTSYYLMHRLHNRRVCNVFTSLVMEEFPESSAITSDYTRMRIHASPVVAVGYNTKVLDKRLFTSKKNFFVLFDSGKSSKDALKRANMIINYRYNPAAFLSIDSRYGGIKCPIMLTHGFYPFRTIYDEESAANNKLVYYHIVGKTSPLLDQVFNVLKRHGFSFSDRRGIASEKPRFIITDDEDTAIDSCFNHIPVLHISPLHQDPLFYNYAVMYGLTVPMTTKNLDLLVYDDEAVLSHVNSLAERFPDTIPSNQNLIEAFKIAYENHSEYWNQLQR